MRTQSILILIVFIASLSLRAQSKILAPYYVMNQAQGYEIESLSGSGFSNTVAGAVFNLSSCNPALTTDFQKPSFGLSYQFETPIDINIMDISVFQMRRAKPLIPQSVGIVCPFRTLSIGFGFTQKYNLRKDYGEFFGTVVDNTTELGYRDIGPFHLYTDNLLKSYLISIATQIPGIKNCYLGLRYYYNQIASSSIMDGYTSADTTWTNRTSFDMESKHSSWSIGFLYAWGKARLGSVYEKGTDFTKVPSHGGDFLCGFYPDQWALGASWRFVPRFTMTGNLRYLIWERPVPYIYWKVFNQLEYTSGIQWQVSSGFKLSAGFFITDYRTQTLANDPITSSKAVFTCIGLVWSMGKIDVDFTIADSH